MLRTWWHQLAKRRFQTSPRARGLGSHGRASCRPQLERLEDRLAPATHIWSGTFNTLWSVGGLAGNWSGDPAPTRGESNIQLIFPAGAQRLANTNDISNLGIQSIFFSGSGYNISGNTIESLDGFIGTDAFVGTNTVSLNIGLPIPFGSGFSVGSGSQLIISGDLVGTLGRLSTAVVKRGQGVLQLSGNNRYGGRTQVLAGTLQVARDNAIPGRSWVSVNTGATLDLNNHSDTIGSLQDDFAGGGSVTLGSGTLTTGADNSSTTFSGHVSGSGSLTKIGTGTFTLGNTNSYLGETVVADGTIQVSQNNNIPSGSAVTVNSPGTLMVNTNSIAIGSLAGNGSVVLGGANLLVGGNNASTTFSGVMSGRGGFVVKVGTGTWTLAGVNTYTTVGRTVVSAGTLQIGITGALRSDTPLQVDAALDLNGFYTTIGSLEGGGRVTLGTGVLDTGSNNVSTAFSGVISSANFTGTEYLVKRGSGTLTLSGANTYTGQTAVVGGTLRVGATNALPSGTPVAMAATLDLNNFNVTIGCLDGQGNVTLGTGTLITGGNNASTTFRGVISGTGGLTKLGSGNFTLTGQNRYVGWTRVSGGNLVVNGSQPGSNVTVDGNASLQGVGTVGSVLVSPAGAIRPGPVGNNGTLHTGNVVFQPTSFLTVNLNGPPAQNDQLSVTGTADLTGNPDLNLILNYDPAIGESFPIIQSIGGVVGTLAGLGEGGVYTSSDGTRFQLHYPGKEVVLTRIAAPADHFLVSAPSSAVAGTPFDITVTALDPNNNIDTVYTGTITFMPSDTDPGVVMPADYPFTAADAGVHTFTDTGLGETTLITPGDQTVTVTDADGLTGSATITVTAGPLAPHGRSSANVLLGAATLSAESLPGRPATAGNVLGAATTEKQAPPLHAGNVDRLFSLTNREDYRLGLSRPQRVAWNAVQQWWEDFASYDHAPEHWVA